MRLAKSKYKLWQIMLAIAALAGLFAVFGVIVRGRDLAAFSVVLLPILLARTWAQAPGRSVGLLPLPAVDPCSLLRDLGHGLVRPGPPTSRVSR